MMRLQAALLSILLFASNAPPVIARLTDQPTAALASAGLESIYTMQVDGWITIDPQGKVADYQRETKVSDDLSEPINRAVHAWLFKPVVIDGVPVRAKAKMRITLVAQKVGETYHVVVDNVTFPLEKNEQAEMDDGQKFPFKPRKLMPPMYPDSLLRTGIEGSVLLGLKFGLDGRVEDCVAIQTALMKVYGRPKLLAAAIHAMEQSALASIKKWRFDVDNSHGVPDEAHRSATITVSYWINHLPESNAGKWQMESRSVKREMPWKTADASSQRVGVSDSNAGELIPVASAIQLASNPIGQAL